MGGDCRPRAYALALLAFARGEHWPNTVRFIIAAVCVYSLAYRFYSWFIARRVLELDGSRTTPAVRLNNGRGYVPTSRWIRFGHHFAAIAGPGPLVGLLAAQFGYLPQSSGLWIGAVLRGCVQDFVILGYSLRRDGRSLGKMVRDEIGPLGGFTALAGVLLIMVILIDRARADGGERDEAQHVGHFDRRRDRADRNRGGSLPICGRGGSSKLRCWASC
jgi:carbon starvation protein